MEDSKYDNYLLYQLDYQSEIISLYFLVTPLDLVLQFNSMPNPKSLIFLMN